MNICLFTQEEISKPLNLRDERAQHIITVLHKNEGDTFDAGIINGQAGSAVITKIEKHDAHTSDGKKTYTDGNLYFSFEPKTDGKQLYPLVMLIGFPRPIQLKRLLRDMAGLGVHAVFLTGTELGEKSYLKSNLSTPQAGYDMLLQGTVQAASTHVPEIYFTQNMTQALHDIENYFSEHFPQMKISKLALDNIRPKTSLSAHLLTDTDSNTATVAAIGSERGWTDSERNLLEQNGFTLLGMGPRVLRTETASTVAASLILSQMGKL